MKSSSYIDYLRDIVDVSGNLATLEETINAMRLANCLLINGNLREATIFLNGVVYLGHANKSEEHWTWNVFGIAMLSELSYKMEVNDRDRYYGALRSFTYLPNDSLAYASKVLGNHKGTMTLLNNLPTDDIEEHFSICEELSDEILELRYFYQYFFMANKPSLFVKYGLRGIGTAKGNSAMELVKQMKISFTS